MPPSCVQRVAHAVIKLDGKRTSVFYLRNPAQRAVLRCELDGCLYPQGDICDWLVKTDDAPACLHVFVELKGHDYGTAFTQLANALREYPAAIRDPATRCYIVGTAFPGFRTQGQKAAVQFQDRFGVQLLTKRSGDHEPL